jgi:hypothetical protein
MGENEATGPLAARDLSPGIMVILVPITRAGIRLPLTAAEQRMVRYLLSDQSGARYHGLFLWPSFISLVLFVHDES